MKAFLRGLAELPASQKVVGVVLVLLAGTVVTFSVVDDDGAGPKPPRPVITITLPGGTVVQTDRDHQLEVGEVEHADEATDPVAAGPVVEPEPDVHEDLVDEQPAGAPADAAEKVLESNPEAPLEPKPPAGAQAHSCPSRPVVNQSSRSGSVSMFVLHYTVSRPGSLDAIRSLFNTPSFGASSHLGLEPSGRCQQWVPFARKAWTQGAFNSVAESVEIMAMGTEPRSWWLEQPIFSKGILASIVRDRLRARGLPLRRVDPVGCTPKAGWTDHNALECGNNHHDVMPAFPYDVLQAQIVQGNVSRAQLRSDCKAIHAFRLRRQAGRPGTKAGRRAFDRRRARVRRAGKQCASGKVKAL